MSNWEEPLRKNEGMLKGLRLSARDNWCRGSVDNSAETTAHTVRLWKEEEEQEEAHPTISSQKQLTFALRGLTGYFEAQGMLTILDSLFGKTWLSSLVSFSSRVIIAANNSFFDS